MTCQELVAFLLSYLEDELPTAHRLAFEEHLRECPDCITYLRTYQEAVRLGREVCQGNEPLPADVPEELIQAILAARNSTQP